MKAFVIISLLLLCGCASNPHSKFSYDVRTVNRTGHELSEVQSRLGDYRCSAGIMVPTAQATYGFFNRPIAQSADVYWKVPTNNLNWKAAIPVVAWPQLRTKEMERSTMEISIKSDSASISLFLEDGRIFELGNGKAAVISQDTAPKYWR